MLFRSGNSRPEILRALVQAGADINSKDNDGKTVLMEIASFWNENPDVLRALFNTWADVETKDNDGKTALMEIASFWKENSNDMGIRYYFDTWADANIEDDPEQAHSKKKNINLWKLRTLIEAGADVNAKDNDGKTALTIAAEHCKYIEIRVLNEHGVFCL